MSFLTLPAAPDPTGTTLSPCPAPSPEPQAVECRGSIQPPAFSSSQLAGAPRGLGEARGAAEAPAPPAPSPCLPCSCSAPRRGLLGPLPSAQPCVFCFTLAGSIWHLDLINSGGWGGTRAETGSWYSTLEGEKKLV